MAAGRSSPVIKYSSLEVASAS